MSGIHEAISKGTLPKAVAQIKIQEEMAAIEKLKEAISKDIGTYGKIEVGKADNQDYETFQGIRFETDSADWN